MSDQSLILANAEQVLSQAQKLVNYLKENQSGEITFKATTAPTPNNSHYDALRLPLAESLEDLNLLVNGPMQWLRKYICSFHELSAWQAALRRRLFSLVPLDKPIHFRDLATAADIDEDRLCRIMKVLTTRRCFEELTEGVFAHSSLSASIAQNKELELCTAFQLDEMFEAASLLGDSIDQNPHSYDPMTSPFAMRHGTSPYKWYAERPEKAARFMAGMAAYSQINRDNQILMESYSWESVKEDKIVDMGGGSGHISLFLAKQYPNLEFIVQDVNPDMLAQGPKFPGFVEVKDRVTFMQHDFFQPQPIPGSTAGLYFIRQIIHNYNDKDAAKIFLNLVPALEQNAGKSRILINDMVLPEANKIRKVEENALRQIDMAMLTGYGAKQRTVQEFEAVLKAADTRYEIVQVHAEGMLGLVEVRLQV
ncbi:O-methyltransferase [Penicillium angulare]|uniref:O-methyltransferase n=1 Tax=Penicillium angulare TaxID=116970 RepID=UPI0025410AFD|nr:O-methyltransferase [Penicillium angulare]KAJ5266788.1 O-methyltransferase [Penicillium angulare]